MGAEQSVENKPTPYTLKEMVETKIPETIYKSLERLPDDDELKLRIIVLASRHFFEKQHELIDLFYCL